MMKHQEYMNSQTQKSFTMGVRSLADPWGGGTYSVRMIALLTALAGVLNVLSAVTPAKADRQATLVKLLPLVVQRGGNLMAALSGFALLVLANGL